MQQTPRAYITRRLSEGKTIREAKRSLKRIIARKVFRPLQQRHDPPDPACGVPELRHSA
jgi:hypothetical protein